MTLYVTDKQEVTEERTTGRMSDGSDHVTTEVTAWYVRVRDDFGHTHTLSFDSDPSDDDIAASVPAPVRVVPTPKTKAEAVAHLTQLVQHHNAIKVMLVLLGQTTSTTLTEIETEMKSLRTLIP